MAPGVSLAVAACMACASLLYATARQAGGAAFLAIMAFWGFPAAEMRPTALLLNIVAAGECHVAAATASDPRLGDFSAARKCRHWQPR
jgi:hypothetical protein